MVGNTKTEIVSKIIPLIRKGNLFNNQSRQPNARKSAQPKNKQMRINNIEEDHFLGEQ